MTFRAILGGSYRFRCVHGLSNTTGKIPCGMVGDAERMVQFPGRHPFLGRGHQMHRNQPLVERNLRAMHGGANGDGELQSTLTTLVQAPPVRLTMQRLDLGLIKVATMRADHPVRPTLTLKPLSGFIDVGEAWIVQVPEHCSSLRNRRSKQLPYRPNRATRLGVRQRAG